MTGEPARPDEFALIRGPIRRLATAAGALDLADDAALLSVAAEMELVIAKDALVEGVHFIGDEPPEDVAAKLLAVNLSDLAAMGAEPLHYLTAAAFAPAQDDAWRRRFVEGLAAEQARHGLSALGGDVVSTPGPLTLSMTIIGQVPRGTAITRAGARPGDELWVSGSLGDGALGLDAARALGRGAPSGDAGYLLDRYRRPRPRLALGQALRGIARAMIDLSDGLCADLSHLLARSAVGCVLDVDALPLSPAAAKRRGALEAALGGGDDYELAFAAAPEARDTVLRAGASSATPISRIGVFRAQPGLVGRDAAGVERPLAARGWVHR